MCKHVRFQFLSPILLTWVVTEKEVLTSCEEETNWTQNVGAEVIDG